MDGSDLSGVSAVCSWEDKEGRPESALSLGGVANTPTTNGSVTELELTNTTALDSVHVKFNMEAALLLPLAIRYDPYSIVSCYVLMIHVSTSCLTQGSIKTWSSFHIQGFHWRCSYNSSWTRSGGGVCWRAVSTISPWAMAAGVCWRRLH